MPGLDLSLGLLNLSVDLLEMVSQPLEQGAEHIGQTVFGVLQDRRQPLGDISDAFRDHETTLKVLTDSWIRLGVVVPDLHGQSARAMVKAIVAG